MRANCANAKARKPRTVQMPNKWTRSHERLRQDGNAERTWERGSYRHRHTPIDVWLSPPVLIQWLTMSHVTVFFPSYTRGVDLVVPCFSLEVQHNL